MAMNRYEKIRNMNIEEVARVIQLFCRSMESCYQCPLEEDCAESESISDIKQWLESEVE